MAKVISKKPSTVSGKGIRKVRAKRVASKNPFKTVMPTAKRRKAKSVAKVRSTKPCGTCG